MDKLHVQANNVNNARKPGARDKSLNSIFCCGFQYETSDHRCPICKKKVIRKATYASAAHRFEEIISVNRSIFDMQLTGSEKELIKIPIRIRHHIYFVPMKHLVEYDKVHSLNHSEYETFFDHIMDSCEIAKKQ